MSRMRGFGDGQLKLNRLGFPIMPEHLPATQKTGVKANDPTSSKNSGLKGYVEDPTYYGRPNKGRGIIEKYFGVPYAIQRKISREVVVVGSIIRHRNYDVAKYLQASVDKGRPGMSIRHKDPEKNIEKKDSAKIREATQWLLETGRRDFKGNEHRKDRLPDYGRKLTRDVLTIDRVATVIRRDRLGNPVDFALRDGDSIKPIDPMQGFDGDKSISHVQEINGQVVASFNPSDIVVDWMYKTSDMEHQWFGWSGIEEAWKEIRSNLDAMKYNTGNFRERRAPDGFFMMGADMEEDDLDELEARFDAMFSDPAKQHRIMFFAGDKDMKWQSIRQNNREMEFGNWMEWLITFLCMEFQIDPEELGIKLSKAASMFGNNNTDKQERAQDRGLGALLDFLAGHLTKVINSHQDWKDYEVYFTGRDMVDPKSRQEQDGAALEKGTSTIYETRKRNDMPQVWDFVDEIFEKDELEEDERKNLVKKYKLLSLNTLNNTELQISNALNGMLQGGGEGEEGMGDEGGEYDELDDEDTADMDAEGLEGEEGDDDSEYQELDDEELESEAEELQKSFAAAYIDL